MQSTVRHPSIVKMISTEQQDIKGRQHQRQPSVVLLELSSYKLRLYGLDDIFVGGEADLVAITGHPFTLGLVIDSDNWKDCGVGWRSGVGFDANVGWGVACQYYTDECEGLGLELDMNATEWSPSGGVSLDDKGNVSGYWGGISIGPGVGACGCITKSYSFTIGDLIDQLRKLFGH